MSPLWCETLERFTWQTDDLGNLLRIRENCQEQTYYEDPPHSELSRSFVRKRETSAYMRHQSFLIYFLALLSWCGNGLSVVFKPSLITADIWKCLQLAFSFPTITFTHTHTLSYLAFIEQYTEHVPHVVSIDNMWLCGIFQIQSENLYGKALIHLHSSPSSPYQICWS